MNLDRELKPMGIYPPTFVKFLARKKDMEYFYKSIGNKEKIFLNPINGRECQFCKNSKKDMPCKSHSELNRIKKYIENESFYYLKGTRFCIAENEIFTFKDNNLLIIYCPHTILCKKYEFKEIFKVIPMTFQENKEMREAWEKSTVKTIDYKKFENIKMKFWFNKDFTMIFEYYPGDGFKYNFRING